AVPLRPHREDKAGGKTWIVPQSWANSLRGVLGTPILLRQRLQQCFGLLEIWGVKALGEPAVDGCQQLVGGGALPLLLPEAGEAHGRPQLPGFGLLTAGNGEGLLETGLSLGRVRDSLPQQQLPLD